jgi:hypothetical protein
MSAIVRRPIFVAILLSFICSFPGTAAIAQGPQGDPLLKTIAAAWSQRQSDLRTVKIVWRQEVTEVWRPRQADAHPKQIVEGAAKAKGAEPARGSAGRSITYESVGTLYLDGDSAALMKNTYDTRIDALQSPSGGAPAHIKSILKGGDGLRYSVLQPGSPGVASFRPASRFADLQFPDNRPLALALRPLTANVGGIDLATYRVATNRPTLNGVSCLLLEPLREDGLRTSYWVDPARDYLILRAVGAVKGQSTVTTDIVYEQNAAHQWMPTRWNVAGEFSGQGPSNLAFCGHTLKTIVNEPIDPKEFTLDDLPVGTSIIDIRSGKVIQRRIEPPALD